MTNTAWEGMAEGCPIELHLLTNVGGARFEVYPCLEQSTMDAARRGRPKLIKCAHKCRWCQV